MRNANGLEDLNIPGWDCTACAGVLGVMRSDPLGSRLNGATAKRGSWVPIRDGKASFIVYRRHAKAGGSANSSV